MKSWHAVCKRPYRHHAQMPEELQPSTLEVAGSSPASAANITMAE